MGDWDSRARVLGHLQPLKFGALRGILTLRIWCPRAFLIKADRYCSGSDTENPGTDAGFNLQNLVPYAVFSPGEFGALGLF